MALHHSVRHIQHWLHSGQEVVVKGRQGEADATMRIEVSPSGALHTIDVTSGEAFELYPDNLRLLRD